MRNISVTEARINLKEIFGAVSYQKERIVFTNHGRKVAVVPIEDLELLEALENEEDIREGEIALKESQNEGSISFDEMKRRVGL